MINRILLASLLALSLAAPAFAEEAKPDDTVSFDLSAEDWVTAKTAHVVLDVEAAISSTNTGSLRSDMIKAVNDAAKADWKLTAFTRNQDQTGLERWSVNFDARLPESALNGLADAVKKASKAGMQITVGNIDFTPTLEESESTRAALRATILKQANEQLASLNSTLTGRGYRISQISFESSAVPSPAFVQRPMMMKSMMMASPAPSDSASAPEHAQKLALSAHVVLAALPPTAPASH